MHVEGHFHVPPVPLVQPLVSALHCRMNCLLGVKDCLQAVPKDAAISAPLLLSNQMRSGCPCRLCRRAQPLAYAQHLPMTGHLLSDVVYITRCNYHPKRVVLYARNISEAVDVVLASTIHAYVHVSSLVIHGEAVEFTFFISNACSDANPNPEIHACAFSRSRN